MYEYTVTKVNYFNHEVLLPNSTIEESMNMYTVMKDIVNVIIKICSQADPLLTSVWIKFIKDIYCQAALLKGVWICIQL